MDDLTSSDPEPVRAFIHALDGNDPKTIVAYRGIVRTFVALFCQTGLVLWLTSVLNAVFRRSGVNEPPAQILHQQAILARSLPDLTEEE